ncbi:MAG: DUF2130 domain-containing protein [Bacteroidetes bacterium]|nr:MAG: DUF2130 domain-containing protein [Bacteroidota bacterium]
MNKLTCPHCKTPFEVDEQGYSSLVKQVRDEQFEKELKRAESAATKEKTAAVEKAVFEAKQNSQKAISDKDLEIERLKAAVDAEVVKAQSDLQSKIKELEGKLANAETEKKLELANQMKEVEGKARELESDLKNKDLEYKLEKEALEKQHFLALQDKDRFIAMKEEEVQRYKDFKQSQSTKMIGESLEQHCESQFNKLRSTAFPNAYFEKDNDASSGSKGDYIFRELDENGVELISIMFEMKNEGDKTATKKKNEDFFKELDKDRNQKNCEYAILVSMLEADNEVYNEGIVDVSHRYEKMYVIRPQFFIPLISLLRNSARNAMAYKQELQTVKNQNIDIANFESEMEDFKSAFGRNYRLASEKFDSAIQEIDKSIARLNKVKENLMSSGNNLRLANDKADRLSIKKLTKNSPSLKDKFDDLGN